jgi:hypothetical protein
MPDALPETFYIVVTDLDSELYCKDCRRRVYRWPPTQRLRLDELLAVANVHRHIPTEIVSPAQG